MSATNYFRLDGKPRRDEIFPFVDGDPDDTLRAWELAVARKERRVIAWRRPRCRGRWDDELRIVGEVRDGEMPVSKLERAGRPTGTVSSIALPPRLQPFLEIASRWMAGPEED